MATSMINYKTTLSSSKDEHQQIQARLRALQKRATALHEELSRSSSGTKAAAAEIELVYQTLINDLSEQRDQLLKRLQQARKNMKQSADQLDHVRHNLNTAQSFRSVKTTISTTPRSSNDLEEQNLKSLIRDVERVLKQIALQLKQYRFVPVRSQTRNTRTLGTLRIQDLSTSSQLNESFLTDLMSSVVSEPERKVNLQKAYVIDIDILPHWIIATIDKRIFLCDEEGEVRIFSYYRHLHRQPLLTERFHLSTKRLITAFTITQDYLVAFESDTQILTLHTHHGALILRLSFPYDPLMMVRADFSQRNQIWVCNRYRRRCYQLSLDHSTKQVHLVDQIDFTTPITNALVDPIGISCDERDRVAVHDVNPTTYDRLLLFSNERNRILSLDFVKYHDKPLSSAIERVLLVPKYPNLIILVYAPEFNTSCCNEIVIVDMNAQPNQILCRLSEPNGIQDLDVNFNGEFVYATRTVSNTRAPSKMHVFRFIDE